MIPARLNDSVVRASSKLDDLLIKSIMIPSRRKVTTGLFKSVLEKGRNFNSDSFSLKVFSLGSDAARFSVVVPKKLEKSAVKRNAIKRRVYSLLRLLLPIAKPGSICTFFIKKKVDTRSLSAVSVEITAALKKSGVIR
ncbi:MAG: ribonuclease P protein component [bacterium]|nr:ribonuclease P protein component [bacterium]